MAELVIRISGKIEDFDKALDEVQGKTEALEQKLSTMAKVSAAAFAALTGEVILSTKAFGEAQEGQNRLIQAMQNQGIYSKRLEDRYNDLATSLQDLTGIDDDAIKAGITVTQSMIGQQEVTADLTKAILDLAAGKKMDLEASAELISKGINGQTAALKKAGIEIDENLSKQERMAKIIEIVNQKYGGQAEAANKGIASMKGLVSAFGNLQEEIGARFAPIIETAIKKTTDFLNTVQRNQPLMDLVATVLGAGVAISGFIAAISAMGVAFISAQTVVSAFGLTMAAALGPITLIAAAIGALGAAVAAYAVKTQAAARPTDELEAKVKELRDGVARLQQIADNPIKSVFSENAKQDLEKAKADLADYEERLRKLQALESQKQKGEPQDAAKKDLADKAATEAQAAERRKREVIKAEQQLLLLEGQRASEDTINLKRQEIEILKQIEDEKNKAIRDKLYAHLAEVRKLEEDQAVTEREQKKVYADQLLVDNEDYQKLSVEQREAFRIQNDAALQSQIQTEATTRQLAAKTKAQEQIQEHNQFLANQQKFGIAYATIYKAMHSEIFQGSKTAFGELVQLQQSSNSTLKGIGKAAAIANIIIKTAESAMNIYTGFSTIPIVGPALGIAGAAAAAAFGAEQVGRVTAAAEGGLITGGIPGVDSVPVLAQHNELVSPARNFEEVIGSVRAAREAEKILARGSASGSGDDNGTTHIILELKDQLVEFIEAKLVERKAIGISALGAIA